MGGGVGWGKSVTICNKYFFLYGSRYAKPVCVCVCVLHSGHFFGQFKKMLLVEFFFSPPPYTPCGNLPTSSSSSSLWWGKKSLSVLPSFLHFLLSPPPPAVPSCCSALSPPPPHGLMIQGERERERESGRSLPSPLLQKPISNSLFFSPLHHISRINKKNKIRPPPFF